MYTISKGGELAGTAKSEGGGGGSLRGRDRPHNFEIN